MLGVCLLYKELSASQECELTCGELFAETLAVTGEIAGCCQERLVQRACMNSELIPLCCNTCRGCDACNALGYISCHTTLFAASDRYLMCTKTEIYVFFRKPSFTSECVQTEVIICK
jgi:hypothetical protein